MQFLASLFEKAIQPYLRDVPLQYSPEGSIVAMFLLVYASKFVHIACSILLLGKYDNVQGSHRFAGKNDGSWTWQRLTVQRGFLAHLNQWEAFLGFSVGMLLALRNIPSSRREELTQLANAFLCFRVLYNGIYLCAFNAPLSLVRSAVWTLGLCVLLKIFSLAVPDIHFNTTL